MSWTYSRTITRELWDTLYTFAGYVFYPGRGGVQAPVRDWTYQALSLAFGIKIMVGDQPNWNLTHKSPQCRH